MQYYTLECAYRFTDGQSGVTVESYGIEAVDPDSATQAARDLAADKGNLTLISAVLTSNATGGIVWSLQAPMSANAVAAFGGELPPDAGT